jgi:type II secretory pathway pseudopilin PulG
MKIENCKLKTVSGFTLIELTISILVLIVLASVGIFSYANSYRQSILNNSLEEIIFLVRLAQQESISQKEANAWGVRFDNTNSASPFVAVFSGSYAPASVKEFYALSGRISFQTPSSGNYQEIIFQKSTGIPSTSTTVVIALSGSSYSKTITINAAGGVSEE